MRSQQELIDGLLRGRTAGRLAAVRLAAALPVPLVEADRHGTVREANPAAAALLHVEASRLRGKPLVVMVQSSDRRALRSAVARAVATGGTEHLTIGLTPRHSDVVSADVVVISDEDRRRAASPPTGPEGAVEHPPEIRILIAPHGIAGADSALLVALGTAAALSAVDGDLRTPLTRLAALAVQGVGPALRASIIVGPPAAPDFLVSTDQAAQAAEGDQHRAGTGPSWDAYATRRPVTAAALHADPRWQALRGSAPAGLDGVAAVPVLRVSGDATGVLTLYGMAGLAEDSQVARTAMFADAAAALLAEHGAVAELRRQEAQLREALTSRAVIDQAKGILMARHGIDADTAFAELVRRSQRANIKLREVALQLVADASSGRERPSRAVRAAPSARS